MLSKQSPMYSCGVYTKGRGCRGDTGAKLGGGGDGSRGAVKSKLHAFLWPPCSDDGLRGC